MSWTAIPSIFYTPATVTVTIATPGVFTLTNHGLVAGDIVRLSTTGALPTGLTAGTQYYVISAGLTANAFEVSATSGGAAINTSGTQSGTHTLYANCSSTRFQTFLSDNLAALMPVGAYQYIHAAPGSSGLVNGCYIEANGQAISRTTYSALFAVIGTTYGSGDGSTTFNVPDTAGRLLVGAAGTGGNADVNALGDSDGQSASVRSARHRHSFSESAHSHTAGGVSCGGPSASHYHTITTATIDNNAIGVPGSLLAGYTSGVTNTDGGHQHSQSVSVTTASNGVTVGPAGSQPVDCPAYLCAGTLFIKAI